MKLRTKVVSLLGAAMLFRLNKLKFPRQVTVRMILEIHLLRDFELCSGFSPCELLPEISLAFLRSVWPYKSSK